MSGRAARLALVGCLLLGPPCAAPPVAAGDPPLHHPLFEHKGVVFSYRVSSNASTGYDTIHLQLENRSPQAVSVSFYLWAHVGDQKQELRTVAGVSLGPLARKGSREGLWYMPFKRGERVTALQLREVNVCRTDTPWSAPRPDPRYAGLAVAVRCTGYNIFARAYTWDVRIKNDQRETAHLSYGVHARERRRVSNRVHVEPGTTHEQGFPSFLPLRPDEAERVLVHVANLRLGPRDAGPYVPANEPPLEGEGALCDD